MRWMFVTCVSLLAGCYSPSLRDCELTCAAGDRCPNGFECRGNVCRAEGTTGECTGDAGVDAAIDALPPDEDEDTDGIANGVDNCPLVSNTSQDNEDQDPFGDACDPCPPRGADNANMDSDGDGVGDGCDPRPNQSGDKILFFVGFASNPGGTRDGETSAWSFSGGRAVADTASDSFAALVWTVPREATRAVTVRAAVELLDFEPSDFPRSAGVVDMYDTSNDQGVACTVGLPSNGAFMQMLLRTTNANDMIVSMTENPAGGGNGMRAEVYLRPKLDSFAFICGSDVGVTEGFPTLSNGELVGVRARGLTAAFDWVMVVDSPKD